MRPDRDMTVLECVECDLKCAELIAAYWRRQGHNVRVTVDRWHGPQAGLAGGGLPTTYRRSEPDAWLVRKVPADAT